MVRRSTPQRISDEEAFPIRVKVRTPSGGFRLLHAEMFIWLDREVGRANYAQHPAKVFGQPAVSFYFRRVEPASRLLAAFPNLMLADGTTSAAYTSPALPFGGDRRSE